MKIAVFPNFDKKDADLYTRRIIQFLLENRTEVYISDQIAQDYPGTIGCADNDHMASLCDVVLAIGGDGTILHAAHHAALADKPILGVNLGRMGFLATLEKNELGKLQYLLQGEYHTRRAMMLRITVRGKHTCETYYAMNDAVVSGALSKIFDFTLSFNGSKRYHFRADGLILATPTGSTAYSMSAGGPVMDPEMESIIFTPLCPHALFSRSTVFSGDKVITVTADNDYLGDVYLTIDGDDPIRIHADDSIVVQRATRSAKFICLDDRNFYDIVDKKIMHSR